MAYDLTKLLKLKALKDLATQIDTLFSRKTDVNALASRIESLEDAEGETNVIEVVKVNGTAVEVGENKDVDIAVPTKVSELTNDSGYQTESDVAAAIAASAHLSRKIVESVGAINLTASDADKFVYLVPKSNGSEDDGYDEYMVISGKAERVGDWSVDLSDYVRKETGKGLSTEDYTTEDKTKLAGISEGATKVEATAGSGTIKIDGVEIELFESATDAEVVEMMNEVFGTGT